MNPVIAIYCDRTNIPLMEGLPCQQSRNSIHLHADWNKQWDLAFTEAKSFMDQSLGPQGCLSPILDLLGVLTAREVSYTSSETATKHVQYEIFFLYLLSLTLGP